MSAFEGGPELLAKREDLCGVAAGGNKWRKLRVLLAEARSQRATVVLTTGAPQSNHCAMTAVAAAMCGLRTELYLQGPDPGARRCNLLIEGLVDAAVVFLSDCSDGERDRRLAARAAELRAAGEVPYLVPLGGSNPLGAAAYASVVDELQAQLGARSATHLVVAAGSLGTVAGLILGVAATGMDCEVHGYSVLWPEVEATRRLEDLLDAARRYVPAARARPEYRLFGSQLGSGYGMPTAAGSEAARLTARCDGLLLDPTYTAKAMAGLVQGIHEGTYSPTDRVVFVHTGGLAGLLANDHPGHAPGHDLGDHEHIALLKAEPFQPFGGG
jgi:1-aminocyclopropane-1-carboxylate deaminase/D-cysteine desulfhydrase-like pyridoxal-dependent ACC family enzyme